MSVFQCSRCGVSAPGLSWGFSLLTRDGWSLAALRDSPGSDERAWLCPECGARQESAARNLASIFAPRATQPPTRMARAPRVLIVDDQVLALRYLMRLLNGYEPVVADSPEKALALLRSGIQFDVVVCDVMMRGMTGPELYARACQIMPTLAPRFVFLSTDPLNARPLIEHAAERLGMTQTPSLLTKPTSRSSLRAAVAAIAALAHELGAHATQVSTPRGTERKRSSKPQSSSVPERSPGQKISRGSQGSQY